MIWLYQLCFMWTDHIMKPLHSSSSVMQQWRALRAASKLLFVCVWTHECVILLIKMDHITQSSCEDKSLRSCCFDYPRNVSGHLAPSCLFLYEEETVSVIMLLSALPGWRAEAEPAAVKVLHYHSLWRPILLSELPPDAAFVKFPIISQGTPDRAFTSQQEDARAGSHGLQEDQLVDSVFSKLQTILMLLS